MDAYQCIVSKRDLRTYARRPLPPDLLRQILDAGRRSGSSRNQQPWEFVVVTEPARRARLARCGRFARHLGDAAAVVVLVVARPTDLFDGGRCAQSLMLAAWSLGVASCPVTLQHDAATREALEMPAGPVIAAAIALGFPSTHGRSRLERLALRVIARRGREPLTRLVHWQRYGNRFHSEGLDQASRRDDAPV